MTSHQLNALNALLAAMVPQNAFYRAKFGASPAAVRDSADFARLPLTTKAELVADQERSPPYGTLLTYPLDHYTRLHQTSGTHGTPLRWLDTPESWNRLVDCWEKIFRIVGIGGQDRLLFAFSFGPFLGFWTAFEAAQRIGCLRLAAGGMSSGARLRLLLDNAATVLLCTPTYALHLAEVAQQQGVDLKQAAVRKLIVAGEAGGSIPATRARIEKAWNARLFDHHGMTEVGPMTIECPESPGGLHLLEDDYIAEVIDPATCAPAPPGTVGELIVTNLGRWGSPLIRYRTGDLVRIDPGPCSCGLPWLRFAGGILGRTDDMIAVRGNNLYPSALENVIRRFAEVAEYRVTVDASAALAELRIEIEPTGAVSDLASRVSDAIRAELLFRAEVVVVAPGTLPRYEMKANRVQRQQR
jgi:phenylacetate-CoA ligase